MESLDKLQRRGQNSLLLWENLVKGSRRARHQALDCGTPLCAAFPRPNWVWIWLRCKEDPRAEHRTGLQKLVNFAKTTFSEERVCLFLMDEAAKTETNKKPHLPGPDAQMCHRDRKLECKPSRT